MNKKFLKSAFGLFAACSLISLATISASTVATQQNVVQKQDKLILKSNTESIRTKEIKENKKESNDLNNTKAKPEDKGVNLVKRGSITESSTDSSSNKKTFDEKYSSNSYWTPTKGVKDKQEHHISANFTKSEVAKAVHVAFADSNVKEITLEFLGATKNVLATKTIKNEKGQKEFVHNFEEVKEVNSVKVTIKDWSGDAIKLTQFGVYSFDYSSGAPTVLIISLSSAVLLLVGVVIILLIRKRRKKRLANKEIK